MSYSHSRKPDLPVTHFSPLSTWLSVLFFFFPPPLKPRCQGRVMSLVGGGGNIAIATAILPSSFIIIIINNKKDLQCKPGRRRLTPYQSEDPSLTLPTYRGKEEKGKIVEDKKGESN